MNILLVRHALAEERQVWNAVGKSDVLRPLTKRGINRFAGAVKGLGFMVPELNKIYCSQYTRAVQTAEILQGFYRSQDIQVEDFLNPGGDYSKIKKILKGFDSTDTVALVGHQPDLGYLCNYLIGCEKDVLIRFKKGGAALVSFLGNKGQLQWLLSQRHLLDVGSK